MGFLELGHLPLEVSCKGCFEASLRGGHKSDTVRDQKESASSARGWTNLWVLFNQTRLGSYAALIRLGVDDLQSFQHVIQPGGLDMNLRVGLVPSFIRCRAPRRRPQSTASRDSPRPGRPDVLLLIPTLLCSAFRHGLGRQARFLLGQESGLFSLFTFGLGGLFFGLVGFGTVFGALGPFFGFVGFGFGGGC